MCSGAKLEVFDQDFVDMFLPQAWSLRMSLKGIVNGQDIVFGDRRGLLAVSPPVTELIINVRVELL